MRGCALPAPISLMSEKQSPHASTRAMRSFSVYAGNGTVSGFPPEPRLTRPVPLRRHESIVAGIGCRNFIPDTTRRGARGSIRQQVLDPARVAGIDATADRRVRGDAPLQRPVGERVVRMEQAVAVTE